MPFVIQAKAFDKSFKVVKCVSTTIVSSNINEVIRAILDFCIQTFHSHKKAQNAYKRTTIKNAPKNIEGENSLLFAYLRFVVLPDLLVLLVILVLLVLFGAFCASEIFL